MVNTKLVIKYLEVLELPTKKAITLKLLNKKYNALSKKYQYASLNLDNIEKYRLIGDAHKYLSFNIDDINEGIKNGTIVFEYNETVNTKKENARKDIHEIFSNIQRTAYDNEDFVEMFSLTNEYDVKLDSKNSIEEVERCFLQYLSLISKIKTIDEKDRLVALKKFLTNAFNVFIMVAIICFFAIFVWRPSIRYNKAIKAMQNGDYEYAEEVLTRLGNFSDAKEELKLVDVYKALNNNDFDTAKSIMNELKNEINVEYNEAGGKLVIDGNETYAIYDGYDFVKWNIKEYEFNQTALTVKLTAVYQLLKYHITYLAEVPSTAVTEYDASKSFMLPTLSKFGYAFAGWSSGDERVNNSTFIRLGTTGDLELSPVFEANEFEISYNLDDGTMPEDTPTSYNMSTQTFTIGQPQKEGYTFVGWTSNFSDTPQMNFEVKEGSFGELKLTAHYVRNEYSIKYDLDGGEGSFIEYYLTNDLITLGHPTKTGYSFKGWDDGSHQEPIMDYKLTYGDLNLKATWEPNKYEITYDVNGGIVVSYPYQVVTYEQSYNPLIPERVGYNFDGWYYEGNKVDYTSYNYADNVTYVAKWIARSDINYIVNHYIQKLNSEEYELKDQEVKMGVADSVIRPDIIPYAGFILPPVQEATINPNGLLVVDYYYERNSFNINFFTNGGEPIEQLNLLFGTFIPDVVATRSGFTFGGWYLDDMLSEPFNLLDMPGYDINLFAWWTEETKPYHFVLQMIDDNEDNPTESYRIIGYNDSLPSDVVLPYYIGNTLITEIGEEAFRGATINSVRIQDNINFIGAGAFDQIELQIFVNRTSIPLTWIDWCDPSSIIFTE